MGNNVFASFWQDYFDHWDEFVRNWYDAGAKGADIYAQCVRSGKLNFDELPEPYMMSPYCDGKGTKLKAVILNLNPGGSTGDEWTKSYSQKSNPGAFLIRAYERDCNKSYRKWVSKWSCLRSDLVGRNPPVCGVEWWQGRNGDSGRMAWVRRFFGTDVAPEEVFAPELCPYHSKTTGFFGAYMSKKNPRREEFRQYVWKWVIKPALVAAIEYDILCVAAVGREISDVLEFIGIKKSDEWTRDRIPCSKEWPLANRTYRIYRIGKEDTCLWKDLRPFAEGKTDHVSIVVTYAPGSNHTPSAEFKTIENKYVKRNV